ILRVSFAISLGLTLIAILNRFTANLIALGSAIAEGIGVTALLYIVALALLFIERPTIRRASLLAFSFLVIVHIHERFLVLACPLLLIALGAWAQARPAAAVLHLGTRAPTFV